MSNKYHIPRPVFDTLEMLIQQYKEMHDAENPHNLIRKWLRHCFTESSIPQYVIQDYQAVLNFLYNYRGSADTFVAYRRDLERLCVFNWLGWFRRKSEKVA